MTLELPQTTRRPSASGTPRCVHHWVIDPADGAESRGHCKHCGEQRCFANSLESDSWNSSGDASHIGQLVTAPSRGHTELADER